MYVTSFKISNFLWVITLKINWNLYGSEVNGKKIRFSLFIPYTLLIIFPVGSPCCRGALTTVCPSEREQICSSVYIKLLPLSRTEQVGNRQVQTLYENEKPGLSEFRQPVISTLLNKFLFITLMSVIFLHEIRSITRRNQLWLLLFILQQHSEAFRDPSALSDPKNVIGPIVTNLSCLKKQLSFWL